MVKIGILSAAHMHVTSYVHQLQQMPEVQISGYWDDNTERQASLSPSFACPSYDTVDAVLADCDAVIICSENIHHRSLAEQAAKAGKHILCEKPLATTPTDAKTMIDVCAAVNVLLMTAFPCRFAPAFTQMLSLVQNGDIGEVLAVRGTNRGRNPGGWFIDKALSGGGAVMDHTVHVTDLLRVLLGAECATVFCEADNGIYHQGFDDTGFLALGFDTGVFATLDASWSRPQVFPTWGDVTMGVVGTKGVLEMNMMGQSSTLYSDRNHNISHAHWGSDMDSGLVRAFVQAVSTGEMPSQIATGIDGLRAVEVVDAAYRSVATGQVAEVVHL